MYQATDKFLMRLKKKIRSEYNYISLASFDELNAISVKDKTKKLFENLLKFNYREYLNVIKSAIRYAKYLLPKDLKDKKIDISEEDFLEYVLTSYNNITGYLYKKEAERKRLRLAEEILTAKEFLSTKRLGESLRRSANLWFAQSSQYSIDLEDKTCIEVFKKAGVKKVKWITAKDHKTCSDCSGLSGKIFEIDKVPSKVHYNCRCYVVPYVI